MNGPYYENSALQRIYRVEKLKKYFEIGNYTTDPSLILSPSFHKVMYLDQLREFWHSFYSAGSLNRTAAVIGFSLPEHDEYIKLLLFSLIRTF